ncbi:FadR/GntR family transcriptional regulator [Gleimia hominis]|uniref:FadR/GntR family transcriptional regulator n=1 Tax=Gleimia hominis TaxID=595468 RepID=UPI000C7F94D4|nr:FCD domain-containing protein [Gleimia hominis]WIK64096.1 FCD domain-containing protein [Gleimia hominis]
MLDNQQQREALLYERICTTLAVEILDGDWPEKTALTLEEIQHRFGISRTVAREVAKLLEAVNAVTVRRRVGLVPNPVQQWDALNTQVIQWKLASTHRKQQLLDLTELRLAIEPAAAASAAQVAPAQVRALMPVLAAQLRRTGEAGELDEFHVLDIQFHTTLLRHSGNELFSAFADVVATVLRGRVELHMYPQRPKPEALDAHEAVGAAVWEGKPEQARIAMRQIVDEVAHALDIP